MLQQSPGQPGEGHGLDPVGGQPQCFGGQHPGLREPCRKPGKQQRVVRAATTHIQFVGCAVFTLNGQAGGLGGEFDQRGLNIDGGFRTHQLAFQPGKVELFAPAALGRRGGKVRVRQ